MLIPEEVVGHGGEGTALLRLHVLREVVVVGIGVQQLLKALLGGSLHTILRFIRWARRFQEEAARKGAPPFPGVLKEPQLANALYTLPSHLLRGFEQICGQFVNGPRVIVGFAKGNW